MRRLLIALFLLTHLLSCSSSGTSNTPKSTAAVEIVAAPDAGTTEKEDLKVSATAGSDGWTTFRGTGQRTGRANVVGPRSKKLKWVFRTQGRIFADAAITPDGKTIYVASHDRHLYAVTTEGREIWSYDAGGKIWTSPSISRDGTIYIGSDADRLAAIAPSGAKSWVFETTMPAKKGDKPEAGRYDVDTSPAIMSDGSIVFGCHNNLFALRPLAGGVRWVFEAGTGRVKIFSSPAIGRDGSIYFGTQGNYFFALSQSAKVLWSMKTGKDNDSTPAIGDDGTVYFGSDDGKLRAVAPGGALRWETDVGAPIRAPISVGHDGTVFASTYGNKPFIAADQASGGKATRRFHPLPGEGALVGIHSGALVDAPGYVYFGGRDHFVYCLSPEGKLVWKHETGDHVDSGPVIGSDGTIYVGSDDKRLYAFER